MLNTHVYHLDFIIDNIVRWLLYHPSIRYPSIRYIFSRLAVRPSQPIVPAAPQAKVSTDLTKMPSQMEHAMETMMFTFHKFAGDKGYLTKEDLRVLMEKEFPGFLENQKDPLAVDKIMKDLDQCRDGKVGFQSFFSLIAGLTIACNDYFVIHMKQKGKK